MGILYILYAVTLIANLIAKQICRFCIFYKAGREVWKCFIPIYRNYVYSDILFGDGRYLWIQLVLGFLVGVVSFGLDLPDDLMISVVTIGLAIWEAIGLATVFNKRLIYAAGLLFLPFIFYPLLVIKETYYG